MRFPSPLTSVLLAIATVAIATGCETVDRVHYDYNPKPLRIKEPRFVEPTMPEQAGAAEEPLPATVL